MKTLEVWPNHDHVTRGNMRARISGDRLYLPEEFASAVRREGVRTADDLLSYVKSFPSAVAHMLNWSVADVQLAAGRLETQLAGHVDATVLKGHREPALGARRPDNLGPIKSSPYRQ